MAATDSATVHQQLQSPLFALPVELVIQTIAQLSEDYHTLCSLARTCRFVQPLCEEHIYAAIELLSTDDLQAICDAFKKRPRRVEAVRTLKMFYKYKDGMDSTMEDRELFNSYISQLKALKEWEVESPFDNYKWDEAGGAEWVERDMEIFREAIESASLKQGQTLQKDVGLGKMGKLIIHSHGATADFWELKGFHCLFRHPSLRYLHISCVTLPSDLPELEPFVATTPLTTLIFDECELETESLFRILSTPKTLKHLTLGENVSNIRRYRGPIPKLTSAPHATMKALMPLAHSLETLTHFDPTFAVMADPSNPFPIRIKGSGMRAFHRLKFIETDRCSVFHRGIISNHTLAPPNLETIRVRNHRGHYGDMFDQLPDLTPYTYLPSVRLLEFVQPSIIPSEEYARRLADYICEDDRLKERHAYAYRLWKSGINMKLYAEMQLKNSYIPPYLYGEPLPELLTIYSSVEVGFHRVIRDGGEVISVSMEEEDDDDEHFDTFRTKSTIPSTISVHNITGELHTSETNLEPPETDQLNAYDIKRSRNEVYRTLERYSNQNGDLDSTISLTDLITFDPPIAFGGDSDDDDDDFDIDTDTDMEDDDFDAELAQDLDEDEDDDDNDMFEDADEFVEDEDQFMDAEGNVDINLIF